MSFLQTRRFFLSLALSPLWSVSAFAQAPAAPPADAARPVHPPAVIAAAPAPGYHWRTLVLRHAVPSDVLALMRWNSAPEAPAPLAPTALAPTPFDLLPLTGSPVPSRPTLPDGVRRIFALQSNNSLLVQATEEGYARVVRLVRILDIAPRQVEFHMRLVAVPAGVSVPDVPASRLLPLLLAGESRVISVPMETVTEGTTASVSIEVPAIPSGSRFRLAQMGPGGRDSATRCEFRLTPRVNADGTVTLSLTPMADGPLLPGRPATSRTVRAGEMVVYEVTGAGQAGGERLFLFLSALVIGDGGEAPDGGQLLSGQTVIVTP